MKEPLKFIVIAVFAASALVQANATFSGLNEVQPFVLTEVGIDLSSTGDVTASDSAPEPQTFGLIGGTLGLVVVGLRVTARLNGKLIRSKKPVNFPGTP